MTLINLWGALGMGVTWGVPWALVFGVTAVLVGVVDPGSIDAGESPWVMAAIGGVVGFVSGSAFAVALFVGCHGKSLDRIRVSHGLLCGAVGGVALPLLSTMPNGNAILTCPLGALFGAATIGLSHRAGDRQGAPLSSHVRRRLRRIVQRIVATTRT